MSKLITILSLIILFLVLAVTLTPITSITADTNADGTVYLPIIQKPISGPVLKWQKGGSDNLVPHWLVFVACRC